MLLLWLSQNGRIRAVNTLLKQMKLVSLSLLLQIFDCPRLKFSEIPQRLTALLLPPDPIVINHVIR